MKTIHADIQTKMNTNIGTSPFSSIVISWDTGDMTYTDDDKILDKGAISTNVKLGIMSQMQNVSVTLDDVDGTLKTKYFTEVIENKACSVYQRYVGTTQQVLLIRGYIIGDVIWSEGDRQLSFSVESVIESKDISYAPIDGDIAWLHEDAVGVAWPTVFGCVVHSKTIRVRKPIKATMIDRYTTTSHQVIVLPPGLRSSGSTTIRIDGTRFSGYYDSNTGRFTVSGKNLPHYPDPDDLSTTVIPLGYRDVTNMNDYFNSRVLWVASPHIRLAGLTCLVEKTSQPTGYMINRCIQQEGRKCIFANHWVLTGGTRRQLVEPNNFTMLQAAGQPRTSWPEGTAGGEIIYDTGQGVVFETAMSDLYLVNSIPSVEILGVYGYRTIDGEKVFCCIPKSYYIKHTSVTIAGREVTAVEIPFSLDLRASENWDGDIYVTVRSTIGSNITQGLYWLITNHTNLNIDSTSFNATRVYSEPYPVSFTVYDQPSAIRLAEQISYLGRIAMIIHNDTVKLKYLSRSWAANKTITSDDTEYKSVSMTSIITEDLKTRVVGVWKPDHSGVFKDSKYIFENNIDQFGSREQILDVFIYNVKELVQKTVDYWGFIYSYPWHEILISNFLNTLAIENYDVVDIDIPEISPTVIRGLVRSISHNSSEHSIQMRVLLDSYLSANVPGFWNGNGSVSESDTKPSCPCADIEECEYVIDIDESYDDKYDPDPDPDPEPEEDPEEPEEDPDPVDDPDPRPLPEFKYRITTHATFVRGEEHELTIQVLDDFGNQVTAIEGTAVIILTNKTDAADNIYHNELELSNIAIEGGRWKYNIVTVDGGSGNDTATIIVSGPLMYRGEYVEVLRDTVDIRIVDKEEKLLWTTYPTTTVTRNNTFTISLTNGPIDGTLNIILKSTDTLDKLLNVDGNLITTILFDGDGDHTSTVKIVGGHENAIGVLEVIDTQGEIVPCPSFPISGIGEQEFEDNLSLTDIFEATDKELRVTVDGRFADPEFGFNIIVYTSEGAIDTSFNGWVHVELSGINSFIIDAYTANFNHTILKNSGEFLAYLTEGLWGGIVALSFGTGSEIGEHCLTATSVNYPMLTDQVCQSIITVDIVVDANIDEVSIEHDPNPSSDGGTSPGITIFARTFYVEDMPNGITLTAPETVGIYDIIGWEVEEVE